MERLDGQVALVTGGAVGLGNAFVRALDRAGARVAVCDLRDIDIEPTQRPLLRFAADVAKPEDVQRVVRETIATLGRIDILVNNAGVWAASRATDDLDKTVRDYDLLIGTNLKGSFMFGRAVIPHMIEAGRGEIVNICTDHVQTCGAPWILDHDDAPNCPWAGLPPRPTGGGAAMDLYDASKWGQLGLTFAWAQALARHNIRVNALCMGATDSQMMRSFYAFAPPAEEVARWMKADDVAHLMLALIADGRTADYVGVALGHPMVLPPRRTNPYFLPTTR
jgi:NAD(P)-dependent dehydrogenase (short-subunit alcohol dehydrogenase family)